MKTKLTFLVLTTCSMFFVNSCSTGPHATRDTAVGAVGGAVVGGPVGAVVAGSAYGSVDDRHR